MKILFVCTGNTCRSPMAQALFASIADEKGLEVTVKSAGIFASDEGRLLLKRSKHYLRKAFH